MKLKLLALILFAMPYQISPMDDNNPNICRVECPNGRQYFPKHPSLPKITIEQCSGCNKPADKQCGACKLTFYCSHECQAAHWNTHKQVCKKLQKTHHGSIAYMRNAFSACIDKAIETGKQKYINEALSWHMQTLIRMAQDKACAHDNTISSANIHIEDRRQLEKLVARNLCTSADLPGMLIRAAPDAIAKVTQLTIDDKLVPPYGVRRYGINIFVNTERSPDEFIPREQWKEKRLAAIAEFEKQIRSGNKTLAESENI